MLNISFNKFLILKSNLFKIKLSKNLLKNNINYIYNKKLIITSLIELLVYKNIDNFENYLLNFFFWSHFKNHLMLVNSINFNKHFFNSIITLNKINGIKIVFKGKIFSTGGGKKKKISIKNGNITTKHLNTRSSFKNINAVTKHGLVNVIIIIN